MVRYEFSTDPPAEAFSRNHWPSETSLGLDSSRPTLLFFVHPKCPCTRASVRELEKVLTGSGLREDQKPRVLVLAARPRTVSSEWHETDILEKASGLPKSQLILDLDGRETSRFGAVSSGTVMLFEPGGRRLFAGGVTASRGHEGDNAGRNALRSLLAGEEKSELPSTPAFGCPLCLPGGDQQGCSRSCKTSGISRPQGIPPEFLRIRLQPRTDGETE